MKAIWKYAVPVPGSSPQISMPIGAEILSLQMQNDVPTIWALVHTDYGVNETVCFDWLATGEKFRGPFGKFIGTVQLTGKDAGLVFHLCETERLPD